MTAEEEWLRTVPPAHLALQDQAKAAIRELDAGLDDVIRSWVDAESRSLVTRETAIIALSQSIRAAWTPGYVSELLAAAITRMAAATDGGER